LPAIRWKPNADRRGALDPVLSAAVLWTTRSPDAAVVEPRALSAEERGPDVPNEDEEE
jgi:hypothetical protein